jgi:hypothetical protein
VPQFNAELMAPLSARHPSMRLTFESDRPSERPVRLFLTLAQRVNESPLQRFPVYYRFMPPADQQVRIGNFTVTVPNTSEASRLVIIVGPGVSVRLATLRRIFQNNNSLILEIYRVQDPSLVPTLGRRFNTSYFLRRFRIDLQPPSEFRTGTLTADGIEADYFDSRLVSPERYHEYLNGMQRVFSLPIITVTDPVGDVHNRLMTLFGEQSAGDERAAASRGTRHQVLETPSVFEFAETNNGLIIEHPNSGQRLIIECSMFHWDETPRSERKDHEARFSWDIVPNDAGLIQLRVMKTPLVRVTLHINFDMVQTNETQQQLRQRVTIPIFDVKDADFNVLPLQGNRLPWSRGREATHMNVILPSSVSWLQAIADVTIGFIPGVGDAVDIAEFVYALNTDQDRWGHRVSALDKVLMGAGAVLSLVGPSIASIRRLSDIATTTRRTAGLWRRLQTMEQPFNRMLRGLQNANLTQGEREFVQQMSARIRRGARLTRAQVERAQAILRRLPACPV